MPSSPSTRTTPSSASPVSSARSIAVVTSPIVTNPRERPSATRSVNCAVSDGPLVTTVRLTRPVCPPSPRFRGTQFYYSDLRFNLRAICASTSGNVSPVGYRPVCQAPSRIGGAPRPVSRGSAAGGYGGRPPPRRPPRTGGAPRPVSRGSAAGGYGGRPPPRRPPRTGGAPRPVSRGSAAGGYGGRPPPRRPPRTGGAPRP